MTDLGEGALTDVSRETLTKLETYVGLLQRWTKKINLVSRNTVEDVWNRHIQDSAQFMSLIPGDVRSLLDIGSGGGLPGAVIAILAQESQPGLEVTLLESDARKSAFLRTVARETKTPFHVINQRIEAVEPFGADVVTARALASLDLLLGFGSRHVSSTGRLLFAKGANWQTEVAEAEKKWSFRYQAHTSTTDSQAVLLDIRETRNA